jgi:hypothetical protein
LKTKYTFDNLVNNQNTRAEFMRDYDKLIQGLKKHGYAGIALKHAHNKKRIAEELALLD